MRGKAIDFSFGVVEDRITPAYAGKRQKGKLFVFCLQDHPRLCGEKEHQSTVLRFSQGSPPPMRGKEYPQVHSKFYLRITPAYAGKRNASVKRHSIP